MFPQADGEKSLNPTHAKTKKNGGIAKALFSVPQTTPRSPLPKTMTNDFQRHFNDVVFTPASTRV
jgi:hypothetical protein